MIAIARSFTRLAALAGLLVAAHTITAPALAASGGDTASGLWLAASATEPAVGNDWGRLALRDGVLAFNSKTAAWQLPVTEIKRASISEQSDRLMVIEGASGETYYVAIIGAQMLTESPRKALQIIQKALRAPAGRRE